MLRKLKFVILKLVQSMENMLLIARQIYYFSANNNKIKSIISDAVRRLLWFKLQT